MRVSNNSSLNNCLSYCREATATPAYVSMYVSLSLLVMFTVCGNVVVVVSVIHFKELHTPTNVLIMSLALADLCVGAFVMPLHFITMIESCWVFGNIFCIICNYISLYFTSASSHTVALIALDRYLALSNPFIYCKKITIGLMIGGVTVNWMFSLVYNFVLMHSNNEFVTRSTCPDECYFIEMTEVWYWVDLVVVFAVPCSIMFVLYLQVFGIALKHAKAIRAVNSQGNQGNRNIGKKIPKQHDRKAAKVLGIIVIIFLICFVPYFIINIFYDKFPPQVLIQMSSFVSSLIILNSAFNPLIYALFYPWFQKCVRLMFRSLLCCLRFSLTGIK